MLIAEDLNDLRDDVVEAVEDLFEKAEANQMHPQDLFMVEQYGYYWGACQGSEAALYGLVEAYQQSRMMDRASFDERMSSDENFDDEEILMVDQEMGLYMRLWQAEGLLKQYRNLVRLACGKDCSWLTLPRDSCGRITHDFILSKIRDPLAGVCEPIHELMKYAFNPQVSDAIANLQYSFGGRRQIHFRNYDESLPHGAAGGLRGLELDDWNRLFQTTFLLFVEVQYRLLKVLEHYLRKALTNGNTLEIRVTDAEGMHGTIVKGYSDSTILFVDDAYLGEGEGSEKSAAYCREMLRGLDERALWILGSLPHRLIAERLFG